MDCDTRHRALPFRASALPCRARSWATVGVFAWAAVALALPAAGAERRTNFVIILCDDLGYGDLGCYGHPAIQTPNLDRLAGEGMRLTECYAAAPVCSPSRAGLLTGRMPYRTGIRDWIPAGSPVHLRRREITVATLLRSAGYATCLAGKWHLNGRFNSPRQPQPGDHGFEHWLATQNNAGPSHRNPVNFVRNGQAVGPMEGYSSALIVDETISWLRARDNRPFFLFVSFHSPHEPIATAEEFVDAYPDAQPRERAEYFGNVTQMDHEVGRLLRVLEELNVHENTLVLFTSDNGPETLKRYPTGTRSYGSPGPLRGMKLELYEGGIRVPAIIRWPGRIPAGQASCEAVNGTDLLPTLCEIAGLPVPANRPIDGISMLPLFQGRPLVRPIPLYWQNDTSFSLPKIALRDGDWKVLAHADLRHFELYNLRLDPGEATDLAEREPHRLRAMSAELVRLHDQIAAEPPAWPAPPATQPR